jgi:hypothetical protein
MQIEGSGRWNLDAGKSLSIDREFIIAWAGHAAWVATQIGTPDPLFAACICRRASVEPMGQILSDGSHTHAKVTLTYSAEPTSSDFPGGSENAPTVPEGATLQIQIRGGGEFMLVPSRDVRWEDNPNGSTEGAIPQEDSAAGRIVVPQQDIVITVGNLATPPLEKLTETLGKVNAAEFMTHPPETVLFESYDMDWSFSVDGGAAKVTWTLAWHLKARLIRDGENTRGWNHEYRGDGWFRVLIGGFPRYETTDFSQLFVSEPPEEPEDP